MYNHAETCITMQAVVSLLPLLCAVKSTHRKCLTYANGKSITYSRITRIVISRRSASDAGQARSLPVERRACRGASSGREGASGLCGAKCHLIWGHLSPVEHGLGCERRAVAS